MNENHHYGNRKERKEDESRSNTPPTVNNTKIRLYALNINTIKLIGTSGACLNDFQQKGLFILIMVSLVFQISMSTNLQTKKI